MELGLLIICTLFGIISAIIGSNKGRSGCGWFIIGFLLGPLGLILALVVSKNEEVIAEESIKSGERKVCPFCAELVKREAIKCGYCGSQLEDTINGEQSLSSTQSNHKKSIFITFILTIAIVGSIVLLVDWIPEWSEKRSRNRFIQNKTAIIAELTDCFNNGNYEGVLNKAKPYLLYEDAEIISIYNKAVLKNKERIRDEILIRLLETPSGDYSKIAELYGKLCELYPHNSTYKRNYMYFSEKARN